MRWRSLVGVVATVTVAAPQVATGQQDMRPGVAVMVFENGGSYGQESENFEALEIGLQQMLITELGVNGNLRTVDRSRIKDLLAEQDAGGRVDAGTAARIGRLVGARYMVLGGFVDFYGDLRLDTRIVNVETGEIVKTEKVRDKRENLYDMVVRLAHQVTTGLNLPPLPRQAMQQRQERDIPAEAVTLYTRALLYQDRGDTARAVELFSQVAQEYPQYTEAQEALRQIRQG